MIIRAVAAIAVILGLISMSKATWKEKNVGITMQGAALVRKALNNGAAVNQTIGNSQTPYPVLTFNQVVHDNLGSFDLSDSSFVIPAGVTLAEFRAQVVWVFNANGIRQLVILRKSPLNNDPTKFEFFTADPVATQTANGGTTTDGQKEWSQPHMTLPWSAFSRTRAAIRTIRSIPAAQPITASR